MLRPFWHGLLDALLPQTCLVCGEWIAAGSSVCPGCQENLNSTLSSPYCRFCGRTAPTATLDADGCGQCRAERHWNIVELVRIGAYEPELRELTLGLKYGGRERNARYLGELLANALRRRPWCAELDGLVPVPMHRLRRRQRPCDHANLLAQATAKRLGLPVLRAVRREKYAPSQTQTISANQRFENVKDCFAPSRGAPARVAGKTLCIVDNLLATGATLHEVSKVLRKLGAKRIYAAIIARSVLPGDFQAAPEAVAGSLESAAAFRAY